MDEQRKLRKGQHRRNLVRILHNLYRSTVGAALNLDDQDRQDKAGGEGVALLDPIEELAEFRPVLVNTEDSLAGCTQDQRERLSGLLEAAKQLEELTKWSRDELLDNIGCEYRDPSELARDSAKIARCTSFLTLILDATQRVETVRTCRSVVKRCARLSKVTKLDVKGLSAILNEGKVSALDYLELGEISSAVRVARIAAGVELPGSAVGPSPYDGDPVVHLSVPRQDLYVRGERDILGERAFANITSHIGECRACEGAVQARRAVISPS